MGTAGPVGSAARQLADRVRDSRSARTAPLVLELDLTHDLVDGAPADPLTRLLAARRVELREVLAALRRARDDDRVAALVVRLGAAPTFARAQELRDAVTAFRSAGKRAVAWTESLEGTAAYLLATGFDEIWLQPSGDLGVTGVAAATPFLHDALEKAGVTAQFVARHEYKSAPESLTRSGYSPAAREATERLVGSLTAQLLAAVADSRGLAVDTVRALVDRAPLTAAEAYEAGLIDRIGYRDEVLAAVLAAAGDGARLRYVARYARDTGGPVALVKRRVSDRPAGTVALVHVAGEIRAGRSGRSPMSGRAAGSVTVSAALRAAVRDDSVRAVVLRVDSPGGSYVASDTIHRHVVLAREAGRPVVVSMGSVAASGGYFVAAPADVVVAEPATVTGSIGVFGGKLVTGALAARLGIGRGVIAEGANATLYSPYEPFSTEQLEQLERHMDRVYDDFTAKVAAGRGLTREQVHEVARGRVWTGADAREHGLVDELGGLERALDVAKERAGLPAGRRARVRPFPTVALAARLRPPDSSEAPAASVLLRDQVWLRDEAWGPFAALSELLGLPAAGLLTLPPTALS